MRTRFGPTLARRLFIASVIAAVAVWVVVMVMLYFLTAGDNKQYMAQWAVNESKKVERFANPQEAAAFMIGS